MSATREMTEAERRHAAFEKMLSYFGLWIPDPNGERLAVFRAIFEPPIDEDKTFGQRLFEIRTPGIEWRTVDPRGRLDINREADDLFAAHEDHRPKPDVMTVARALHAASGAVPDSFDRDLEKSCDRWWDHALAVFALFGVEP